MEKVRTCHGGNTSHKIDSKYARVHREEQSLNFKLKKKKDWSNTKRYKTV